MTPHALRTEKTLNRIKTWVSDGSLFSIRLLLLLHFSFDLECSVLIEDVRPLPFG